MKGVEYSVNQPPLTSPHLIPILLHGIRYITLAPSGRCCPAKMCWNRARMPKASSRSLPYPMMRPGQRPLAGSSSASCSSGAAVTRAVSAATQRSRMNSTIPTPQASKPYLVVMDPITPMLGKRQPQHRHRKRQRRYMTNHPLPHRIPLQGFGKQQTIRLPQPLMTPTTPFNSMARYCPQYGRHVYQY